MIYISVIITINLNEGRNAQPCDLLFSCLLFIVVVMLLTEYFFYVYGSCKMSCFVFG